LGDGTATERHSPVQVVGLSGVVSVAAGASDSLAVRSDGTAWVWGINANGQLGVGTTVESHSPLRVTSLSGVMGAAGGNYHSLFLISAPPIAACQNIIRALSSGAVTVSAAEVNNGSSAGDGLITAVEIAREASSCLTGAFGPSVTFTCADLGAQPVTLRVTQ